MPSFSKIKGAIYTYLHRRNISIKRGLSINGKVKFISIGDGQILIGKCLSLGETANFKACNESIIQIGDSCFFNNNASITSLCNVKIGSHCTFGNNLVIVDHDHDYRSGKGYSKENIVIGNNVWVGANVVLLKGTEIGDNAVIAAGSIIKDIVESNTLVYQDRSTRHIEISERNK